MRLHWIKASYRRYYAKVGPLSIEVRRVGLPGRNVWHIGEMFGNSFLDRTGQDWLTPREAMEDAERLVRGTLARALTDFNCHRRGKGGVV